MLGRSYARACVVFWVVDVMGGGGWDMPGGRLGVVGAGRPRGWAGGGWMIARQRRAPVGSRMAVRMVLPCGSLTRRRCLSTVAVQSASHNFPRLMRLLVNSGMMWPVRAWRVGMVGMASWAAAVEEWALPVAVRMVMGGAAGLMLRSGASEVK